MTDAVQQHNAIDRFDSLSVDDLRRRGTAKWSYLDDDVLAAWVAEMDFPIAAEIRDALHDAVERGTTGYPTRPEDSGLPAACAAWLARSFGAAVDPGRIRIIPDVLRGLTLAIEAFSPPDSAVVIPTPAYPPFFEVVRMVGRPIVEAPLLIREGYAVLDLDAIDAALRAGAGTVILCNPHNPLGRVFRREELTALAGVVERHGARVVSDEAHAPLVYPGATHISYSTVGDAAARHSATIVSASKGWNLPGLKCAQILLTNADDVARWDQLPFLRTHGASILGILANRVAYAQGAAWLSEVVAYLDGNRALLGRLLAELMPHVRYVAPEGTYLAWLDCRALDLDKPGEFFLEQARVALSDGAPFGEPGRGWVRLNFATSRAILTTIVQNMAGSLQRRTV